MNLFARKQESYSTVDCASLEQIIAEGGGHETMPVWGEVLTPEQLDALVTFTLAAAEGLSPGRTRRRRRTVPLRLLRLR